MEATEVGVYGFIYTLVCQQIREQMIMRTRVRRTKSQIFNYGFLGSSGCYFCTEVCVDAESQPGVAHICQRLSLSDVA